MKYMHLYVCIICQPKYFNNNFVLSYGYVYAYTHLYRTIFFFFQKKLYKVCFQYYYYNYFYVNIYHQINNIKNNNIDLCKICTSFFIHLNLVRGLNLAQKSNNNIQQ